MGLMLLVFLNLRPGWNRMSVCLKVCTCRSTPLKESSLICLFKLFFFFTWLIHASISWFWAFMAMTLDNHNTLLFTAVILAQWLHFDVYCKVLDPPLSVCLAHLIVNTTCHIPSPSVCDSSNRWDISMATKTDASKQYFCVDHYSAFL